MYITDENAIDVINQLFEKLTVIMPAFKQAWPNEGDFELAKKEWMIAFKSAGITSIERVRQGIDHFRLLPKPFVPSPGEFISMCKHIPQNIGSLSIEDAYREACKNAYPNNKPKKWSHPCIRYAAYKSDMYFLRTAPRQKSFPCFEKNYLDAIGDYQDGKIMDQIENKRKDTPENRIKYQEEWGGGKLYGNLPRPTYNDWLSKL